MSNNPFTPGGISILMDLLKSAYDVIMISHFVVPEPERCKKYEYE